MALIRYRKSRPMSEKGSAWVGIILGFVFMCISAGLIFYFATLELPEDVQWYEGRVNQIISERVDYKRESGSSYKKRVYDCEVSVAYIVNGETYEHRTSFNNHSKPIKIGAVYYLQVSPSNPSHVYMLSTSPNSSNVMVYVIAGVFGIVGAIAFVAGIRELKKLKNNNNIPVGEYNDFSNVDVNSYTYDTSYNTDYNANYNTSYNTMEGQPSNYSGTSIDKMD